MPSSLDTIGGSFWRLNEVNSSEYSKLCVINHALLLNKALVNVLITTKSREGAQATASSRFNRQTPAVGSWRAFTRETPLLVDFTVQSGDKFVLDDMERTGGVESMHNIITWQTGNR